MRDPAGGKLKHNQRLVDLNKVQAASGQKRSDHLDAFADALDQGLANANAIGLERGVYEVLAGPR